MMVAVYSGMRKAGFWALLLLMCAPGLASQTAIGTSARIWSRTLQERRQVFIYLPDGYHDKSKRFPVLYLLDAENQFHHSTGIVQFLAAQGRIPELIVIGITNTDRDRDLTPPTSTEKDIKDNPTAGGGDRFLTFMVDELAPWVESRYRTEPFRILVGHSYGGLLNIYALTTRSKDFQANIAISPALGWDSRHYLEAAEQALPALPGPHFLFVGCGDQERGIARNSEALADWIRTHPVTGLTFVFKEYPGEVHGTTPHRSLYDGLEALYAPWRATGASRGADH